MTTPDRVDYSVMVDAELAALPIGQVVGESLHADRLLARLDGEFGASTLEERSEVRRLLLVWLLTELQERVWSMADGEGVDEFLAWAVESGVRTR